MASSGMSTTKVMVKLGLAGKTGEDALFCKLPYAQLYRGVPLLVLKSHAILLHLGGGIEVDSIPIDSYDASFIYTDLEGDRVLITTASVLEDALEEAKGASGTLKILADVKLRKGTDSVASAKDASQSSVESSTQTPSAESKKDVEQKQPTVVESVSGVELLVEPVAHMIASRIADTVSKLKKLESSWSAPRETLVGKISSTPTTSPATEEKEVVISEDSTDPSPTSVPPGTDLPTSSSDGEVPFIHGRHTCDACLTTPIIGNRYHATNLPDYDLCETCKENYKGSEIVFEVAELDRDRPCQEKWRRRLSKWGSMDRHCRRRGPGHGPPLHRYRHWGPMSFGPGSHCHPHPFGPPNPGFTYPHQSPPHSFGPPNFHEGHVPPTPSAPVESKNDEFDLALKEAIRRSLEAEAGNFEVDAPQDLEQETGDAPAANINAAAQEQYVVEEEKSFSIDAEGSGDVAAFLGATLDKVAEAIDSINTELDRKPTNNEDPKIVVETVTVGDDGEEIEENDATILDGDDDDDKEESMSWHVVPEDQLASDEALARAAQVIGSVLFNSDIALPNSNNASIMSRHSGNEGGSSVSSVSSVPTSVPSLLESQRTVSPAQLSRWANQLSQLHELGFDDDVLSVDILERLQAANLGVDSYDEVTVQQVVNEMMKGW